MKNNEIKFVVRAGGLVETNSSSSHALSICSEPSEYVHPGDIDFDLDIRDGVLYIPCRDDDFGWEYEKSNSCLTKLQYVCALFFNSWEPLSRQKKPKKLETLLKRYLKVRKVVFEWETKYKQEGARRDPDKDVYIYCPSIDHNSYSESYDEIMESNDTIIDFIFNRNSWYFGGNDNSEAPSGYYAEMKSDNHIPNGTVSIDFPPIGRVDFRIDLFYSDPYSKPTNELEIINKIREFDDVGLFDRIYYFDGAFRLATERFHDVSADAYTYLFEYRSKEDGKVRIAYVRGGFNRYNKKIMDLLNSGDYDVVLSSIGSDNYVEAEVSIVSDEFGKLC